MMNIGPIKSSKPDSNPAVIQLPIEDSERKARLAVRIAGVISGLGLTVFEVNACVRIGLVCMDQGSTLIGAYDHAVKVARRIVLIKTYTERVVGNKSEASHG
jgi:hypothetical protein